MTMKMTSKKEKIQPYEYPDKLTVPCSSELKEGIYSLASVMQKNKKKVAGEFSNRITPASLCRVGLELLLQNSKKLEGLQVKDEADLLRQLKSIL